VDVLFVNDKPLTIELPSTVALKVVESADGVKGDNRQQCPKPATLETGLVVNVPLFIKPARSSRSAPPTAPISAASERKHAVGSRWTRPPGAIGLRSIQSAAQRSTATFRFIKFQGKIGFNGMCPAETGLILDSPQPAVFTPRLFCA